MKLNIFILLILGLIVSALDSVAQEKGSNTVKFETLGKCGMCKERIEGTVNSIDGISYVFWNYAKNETIVTYDESKTDPYIIMQAIADTGHDTEWYPAPADAYNQLVGTCCEYERTIDYTFVEIGYLKLMGIWVNQMSFWKIDENKNIKVYPTITDDIIHIESEIMVSEMEVDIYSMNGAKVLSGQIESNNETGISLSWLTDGHYMLILTNNKKIISVSRIIKQ